MWGNIQSAVTFFNRTGRIFSQTKECFLIKMRTLSFHLLIRTKTVFDLIFSLERMDSFRTFASELVNSRLLEF